MSLANKQTYEIMTLSLSASRRMRLYSASTRAVTPLKTACARWDITWMQKRLDKAFAKFKALADKKKVIKDRDLEALVGAVPVSGSERYTLVNFVINSGNSITLDGVVRVKHGDETKERVAASDGPINAAFRAINKIVGRDVVLEDYSLKAMNRRRGRTGRGHR